MSYRCELLLRALFPEYDLKKAKSERLRRQLKKNGYASFVLSEGFVRADEVITLRITKRNNYNRILVVCPRCGEIGVLCLRHRRTAVTYMIRHPDHTCIFSRSSDGYDWLDRVYRQVRQEWRF